MSAPAVSVLEGSSRPATPMRESVSILSTVATLATAMSFLAILSFALVTSTSLLQIGLLGLAQTVAYAAGHPAGSWLANQFGSLRTALWADIASTVAAGALAFGTRSFTALVALAMALGAVRAVRDRAGPIESGWVRRHPDRPAREGIIRIGGCLAGAAAAIGTIWFGVHGGLWLLAMMFAICAVLAVAPARQAPDLDMREAPAYQPDPEAGLATESASAVDGPVVESALPSTRHHDPVLRRFTGMLFVTHLLAMTGMSALIAVWVGGVMPSADALGAVFGTVVVGVAGGGLVLGGLTSKPVPVMLAALGFVAVAAAVNIVDSGAPLSALVHVAGVIVGVGMSSVLPAAGLPQRAPGAPHPGGLIAIGAYAGIPLAAVGAGVLVGDMAVVPAVLIAASTCVLALAVPIVAHRTWHRLDPIRPPSIGPAAAPAKLTARVTVTLAYANGQWIAEVRQGRALLGSRHLIRSAEALDLLARLDLPGVRRSVESALATDQQEAASQAERMRGQLADVESKLAGLTEMLDITDQRRPSRQPGDDVSG